MAQFTDSVYGKIADLKPNCSKCYDNDCVELIDSMLEKSYGYPDEHWNTLPIWHCSRCKQVFGDRSNQMGTICNSHYYDRLTTSNGSAISEKDNKINFIENRVNNIETKIDNINNEIQKQKDDILHALKDRINNFKLS